MISKKSLFITDFKTYSLLKRIIGMNIVDVKTLKIKKYVV